MGDFNPLGGGNFRVPKLGGGHLNVEIDRMLGPGGEIDLTATAHGGDFKDLGLSGKLYPNPLHQVKRTTPADR